MSNHEFVIIGSGVLGMSAALAILKKTPTASVCVIGESKKIGSATLAAGAMLGCYGEITKSHLSSEHGKVKFACSIEAKNRWNSWVEFVGERSNTDTKINPGTFVINNHISGNIDTINYRTILDKLSQNNETFEEVDFECIPGVETTENNRSLQAIYIPGEGSICAVDFLMALEKACATYQNFSRKYPLVNSWQVSNQRIQTITLDNGEKVTGQHIILAAGAYSQQLLDQIPELSKRIPRIFSGVGHALILSQKQGNAIQNVIRTPNRAGACGLHALPQNNTLYVGATNEIKVDPDDTFSTGWVHFLLECVLGQINQNLFASRLLDMKVGNRPSPIDGFPLLGQTSIDNLHLLTGTYRDGFHQSPYLSELVADSVVNKTSILNDMFVPERAPIQTMTRDEAITEAVEHHMASAYEAGAKFPHAHWDVALKRYLERDIREIYQELDTSINLLPEHTLMLRENRDNAVMMAQYKTYFNQSQCLGHIEQKTVVNL